MLFGTRANLGQVVDGQGARRPIVINIIFNFGIYN